MSSAIGVGQTGVKIKSPALIESEFRLFNDTLSR